MYMSGVFWDLSTKNLPSWLSKILMLNPYAYIINGFRDTFSIKDGFEDKPQLVVLANNISNIYRRSSFTC